VTPGLVWPEPQLSDGIVRLRPWRAPDDLAAVEAASADATIPAMSSVPARYDEVAARDWIARQHTKRIVGTSLSLAVADAGTDTALGMVGLMGIDWVQRRCELGYWTVPASRGRGAAGRAAALLVEWAWRALPLVRIDARIAADNVASQRVAEQAGLVREGLLRAAYRVGDRWLDMALYADVRADVPRTSWAALYAGSAPGSDSNVNEIELMQ
jgi:[ribosomal protein S5]-alanine N-acetyltransferase